MKKIKIIIIAMALVLLLPINVNAAPKVKLSSTKKTIEVGKTVKISLKNNKKKVKWSVSNGKIKIVKKTNKYAKIKAIKKGTATLKAKVGKKTYKCKITVKKSNKKQEENNEEVFDKTKAKNNISISEFEANGYVISKLESKYSLATAISAKCNFYDETGNPVDYHNDTILYMENGKTCFLKFKKPNVEYSTYSIEYEYSPGLQYFYHKPVIDNVSITHNYVNDPYNPYIMITATNSNNYDCYYVEVAIVYYGKDNNIVDVQLVGLDPVANSSDTQKAYIPFDYDNFKDIEYERYDVFITYGYHLGK